MVDPTSDGLGEVAVLRRHLAQLEAQVVETRNRLDRLLAADASAERSRTVDGLSSSSSTGEKLALFRRRFSGREDAWAARWTSRRTGRSGWSPAVRGDPYRAPDGPEDLLPLTDPVLERHLRGDPHESEDGLHVGVYPLRTDERCAFLACDFDDANWRTDAAAFVEECRSLGIDALSEISRSGSGAHVWMFFETPVAAALARSAGAAVLAAAMRRRPRMSFTSYDRFFPTQDTVPARSSGRARLGNLIALPLQGDCRRRGTTVFADPETWEVLPDQFAALAAVQPVSAAQLEAIATSALLKIGPSETVAPPPRAADLRAAAHQVFGRTIDVRIAAMIGIPLEGLPGVLLTELKHLAAVVNPEFYRKQAQRFSTFGTPRIIPCFELDDAELRIPRGLLDEATALLERTGLEVRTVPVERVHPALDADFHGELLPSQREAVEAVLLHDTGVLVAPPGAGKTVMACSVIAARALPTAVLVNRAELLDQWRDRLGKFLGLADDQIGQLGAGRRRRTGVVDLVMMQSVSHRNADPSVLEEYGQIVIDECHAVAAPAIEAALRQVSVPKWLGLTATPYRSDQLNGLITMQCGPVRHVVESRAPVVRRLVVHETTFTTVEEGLDGASIQAIYTELAADRPRNELIAATIQEAAEQGRASLVLTNRIDHVQALMDALGPEPPVPVLQLHGRLSSQERAQVRTDLAALGDSGAAYVLLAIDKVAGEGFDLPSLDTLFLAVPVSFKGRVVQQVGRITRGVRATSDSAVVHDFRDSAVPLLDRMHARRRRVMLREGFVTE